MSEEKKYSAKEAAIAVLKKAEEVLKKSELVKCGGGAFTKVHEKAKREGYSEASADKIAGHVKAMEKNEDPKGEIHPKEPQVGESEQPGARVQESAAQPTHIDPKQNTNPEWGTTPGTVKGHFKLAKFCGHISAKRKAKAPAQGAM